jgi:hypothetical protein
MTVRIDLNDENSGSYTSEGWKGITRIAVIDGLTGTRPQQRLAQAVTALQQNGTYISQGHPFIPGVALTRIDPEHLDSTTVKLRLFYEQASGGSSTARPRDMKSARIDFDSSCIQEETRQGIDGKEYTVSHTYPDDYEWDDKLRGKLITQPVSVSVYIPCVTFNYTLYSSRSPLMISLQYVGKTNSSPFEGFNGESVLCTRVGGSKAVGDPDWEIGITFIARPVGTWKQKIVFIDPNTGFTPPDGKEGKEWKLVKVYKTANFGGMRF